MIPLSEPCFRGKEWHNLKQCIESGWVSYHGPFVTQFEKTLADYLQRKFATSTINGTAALHLSLLGTGVQPQDEVMVPTLTFVAPVNAVKYCQAFPIFMDCDPKTLCISADKIADFLKKNTIKRKDGFSYNRMTKRRIKALIVVHLLGHPADMDALHQLCESASIDLIEDAAESLGSRYKGKLTGSFGKVACFSFNGNKIVTAGGGGMVVTDDENLYTKMRHLSTQAKKSSLTYDHDAIGYNYRLSNLHAAVGMAQMESLDDFIEIKRKNAHFYRKLFETIDIEMLDETSWAKSNFWFYTIRVPNHSKEELINFLASKEIQTRPLWNLVHTLPMYQNDFAYHIEYAPIAFKSYLNIPCSVNLTKQQMEYVASCVDIYFKGKK